MTKNENLSKKPLKWDNLLEKCKKCGSTDMQRLDIFKGMFKKRQGSNYRLYRCKSCGNEEYKKI